MNFRKYNLNISGTGVIDGILSLLLSKEER